MFFHLWDHVIKKKFNFWASQLVSLSACQLFSLRILELASLFLITSLRSKKMTRQAAKRPPTGKPKVSKVTSGYGGDMIPSLGPSEPNKGGLCGCSVKKVEFWAKNGPPYNAVNTNKFSFRCSAMMVAAFLSDPGKPGVRSMGPDVCPSLTPRRCVRLNWCDSGWWGYQLNTNW